MSTLEEAELCFPHMNNQSCRKPLQTLGQMVPIYITLSCISLLTVMLNLMVIISISHFRQLHTCTNLLLLSLAVADLLVGFLLMPMEIVLRSRCWFLGAVMCHLFYATAVSVTSASVGTMVLISVDRYVAICDPLCYPNRVTLKRVRVSVCLPWCCSIMHGGVALKAFEANADMSYSCYGECVVGVDFIAGTVDVVVSFIGPIAVIIVLYMKVFVVAVSQARAMRSHFTTVTVKGSVRVTAKKSERKAARTLGILVLVFLFCYCPYFIPSFAGQALSTGSTLSVFNIWLLYCNSCMNPLIYSFFYPWFRKCIKLIVTLQILKPNSSGTQIL